MAVELRWLGPRGGHKPGRCGLGGRASWACDSLVALVAFFQTFGGIFWSKKIIINFYSIWTPFVKGSKTFQTQFITRRERGKNIIRSNYSSKAHGTSRSRHLKNTRERDQTHSYWYIPSAPRENYSLLVMESIGMMKMVTEEGVPPPAGCRNGSRLVFGGYGGFWRRNSRSIVLSDVFRVYGDI